VALASGAVAVGVALAMVLMLPLPPICKPKLLTVALVASFWQQIRVPLSRTEEKKYRRDRGRRAKRHP
jgi:hypothetical protein